jgi:hypothetical protein
MAISPRIVKGALVRLDGSGDPLAGDALIFQFNPTELTRRVDRVSRRPPRETISFTVEFDATDAMETPADNPTVAAHGIYPMLAALESLMHPLPSNVPGWLEAFLGIGAAGGEPPIALFVWGEQRAIPVRVTRLGVTEDQHDPALRPLRATVDVELSVVTDRDFPKNESVVQMWQRYVGNLRDMARLGFSRLP